MLDGRELGDKIVSALADLPDEEKVNHRTVWRTIASAIVNYLKEKAEVYSIQTVSTATFQPASPPQGTPVQSTQTVNGKIK